VRRDQDAWEDAAAILAEACAADPANAYAQYGLGCVLLTLGRYAEGFTARLTGRHSVVAENRLPGPAWRGEPLRDHGGGPGTLLLHNDGGLGDAIMFARYVPMCAERVRVAMAAQPQLERLFATLPGLAAFAGRPPLPRYHAQLPLEHLPLLWGTTPERVPLPIPYLSADAALTARFAARFTPGGGRRIGLAWAGNRSYAGDAERSVPPALLTPLLEVEGVTFVSLQVGAAPLPGLIDWTAELRDFADTAALIAALDLVISVDTAVAHLAGAMGRPVWLLNRSNTDWRWGLQRTDCAWYPTLRQFRQRRLGDWRGVIAEVRAALEGG
jgi:hypothetical protein